jgi:integrase
LPVSHWAPHDLRRTARTRLAALGCPEEVSESILGHVLPGVQGVYNQHAYDAEKVEWLKRLSEHLESLAAL